MDENRVARTLISHDKSKDMAVFTHAKKLSEYIFVITEKSPKKLRWSIITRMQNISVEIIENLYRANLERGELSVEYQKRAYVNVQLLDYYASTAKTMQAINNHQMLVLGKSLLDVKKLLLGWVKATKNNLST